MFIAGDNASNDNFDLIFFSKWKSIRAPNYFKKSRKVDLSAAWCMAVLSTQRNN